MGTERFLDRARVLCVDDDPAILTALHRVLGTGFDVTGAESATAALELVRRDPGFAVVVTDYRMPATDGVTLLGWIREIAPDTVSILLTGAGDFSTAVDAVNRGQIFRFLSKPAPPDVLRAAVTAAASQYRLVTAERVLLEQTLRGSIKALTDVLALAQPEAFGRATRVRRHAVALADRAGVRDRWPIEIAAMLSQVGCAALPGPTLARFYAGEPLLPAERAVVATLPAIAERLIADIPRLEAVREILKFQDTRYDGLNADEVPTQPGISGDRLPLGARILKIVLDFDLLEMQGFPAADILRAMRGRDGWYDPALFDAFCEQQGMAAESAAIREIRLSQVRAGMVFAADVQSDNGVLLVARGQEVSVSLVDRIRHQWEHFAATHTVSVLVDSAGGPSGSYAI